jgi:hypothetical protein
VLASRRKPSDLPMGYFMTLIAKYYYSDDIDYEKLSDIVKKVLLEFNLEHYQEYKYHDRIMSICKKLYNGTTDVDFKEREYIPIYEGELAVINSLDNDRQKKLMFTFFAVARFMDSYGWINKKTSKGISEVFKLANVNVSSKKRTGLLHELYINGYISFSKKISNLNIRVELDNTGSDVVYKVREFTNVGNQYIGNFKKGYKQCQCCGAAFKVKSKMDYSSKYCSKCAKKTEAENAVLRKRKQREAEKCHESLNL